MSTLDLQSLPAKNTTKMWSRNRKGKLLVIPSRVALVEGSGQYFEVDQIPYRVDQKNTCLPTCFRKTGYRDRRNMRPLAAVLIIITVVIQLNQQQFVVLRPMYERWENECLTVLTAAMIRGRNRRQSPYGLFPVLESRGLIFTTMM